MAVEELLLSETQVMLWLLNVEDDDGGALKLSTVHHIRR